MILHSIEVSGWGSFASPCRVGPFGEALNVLYAPNATGKSLLFEALRRGLLDGHRVTGQAIEALRPWGRNLAPSVTLEFSAKGSAYLLEKRFLDGPKASLSRREEGAWVPLAEGDDVTDRMRALLDAETPGRGPTKREHWGQAQVLWAPQGQLSLPEEGLSGGLVAAIRASLGGQLAGAGGALEEGIAVLYDQLFTPGGRLKSGKEAAPLVRLEEQRTRAQEERAIAQADVEEFERLSSEVAGLRAAREQARGRAGTLTAKLAEARAAAEAYASLREQRNTCLANEEAAQAKWQLVSQRIDKLADARERKAQASAATSMLGEQEEPLLTDLTAHEQRVAEYRQQLEDLRAERDDVRAAEEEAAAAVRLANAVRETEEAERILEAAAALEEEIGEQQTLMASLLAPDEGTLDSIRKLVRRRDRAQDKIEAARITLEVEALCDEELLLLKVEQRESDRKSLRAGEVITVRGVPDVAVELPGVARVRARGPAVGLAALREERAQAEAELAELVAGFGSSDLPVLEERYRQRGRLEAGLDTLRGRLEATLHEHVRDELDEMRTLAVARRDELLNGNPSWREDAPQPDALTAAAAELRRVHEEAERELEAHLAQAEQTAREVEKRLSRLRGEVATTNEKRLHAEQEEAQLSDDGLDDAGRAERRAQLALEWDAAKAKLDEIEQALEEIEGDPVRERERLERERESADAEAQEARDKEVEAHAQLQSLTGSAPYDRLARAEEKLATLEQRLQDERLRSDAIRLLHDTLHDVRREAVAAVAGSVEEMAMRTLQRISGPRLGRLSLGEHFDLHAITPAAASGPIDMERLSGGEQEQVHFAVRLALAEVLARDERQLVVLDDVLIATDERRFPRVLEIMEEAAGKLQLLILTCHPSRYSGLAGSHVLDLERSLHAQVETPAASPVA